MGKKVLPEYENRNEENVQYSARYDKWLRSYGMLKQSETYVEKSPYIYHGYRPIPSTLVYCIKSAFYPHHDLMNFWTHFLAFFLFAYKGYVTMTTLNDPFNMVYAPYWIQVFGSCYIPFASSFAHLFNCHSPYIHEACYCFDYTAISVMGSCFLVSYQHYLCPISCCTDAISPTVYLGTMFIGCVMVAVLAILSRFPSCPQRYIFRFVPSGLLAVIINIPLIMKIFSYCDKTTSICTLGDTRIVELILKQAVVTLFAYYFVLSRFPEKFFPGYFDIFGHSHQIFHVLVAYVLYCQTTGIEEALYNVRDLYEQGKLDAEDLKVTSYSTFGIVCVTFLVGFVLIIKLSKVLEKNVGKKKT